MSAAEAGLFAIDAFSRDNGMLSQHIRNLQTRLKKQADELAKLRKEKAEQTETRKQLLEAPNYFTQFLEQTDLFNEPNKRVKMEDIWVSFQSFCLTLGIRKPPSRRSFGIFLTQQPLLDKGRTNFGVYYYRYDMV